MARKTAAISAGEKFVLNQEVHGIYRGSREGQFGADAPLVDIEIDGEVKTYYGKVALARKLANVPEGSEVWITFLGLKPHPSQKGKTFNDFSVEYDDGEGEPAPKPAAKKTAAKPAAKKPAPKPAAQEPDEDEEVPF